MPHRDPVDCLLFARRHDVVWHAHERSGARGRCYNLVPEVRCVCSRHSARHHAKALSPGTGDAPWGSNLLLVRDVERPDPLSCQATRYLERSRRALAKLTVAKPATIKSRPKIGSGITFMPSTRDDDNEDTEGSRQSREHGP